MNRVRSPPRAGATLGRPHGAHDSHTSAAVAPTLQMRERRTEKLK